MKRLLACGVLALVCACQKGPVITSFTADRTEVQAGDVVTLTVAVENASSLVLDPGANKLRPVSHSFQISLKGTVELVLTASRSVGGLGWGPSAQARLTIHVTPRPPLVKLSASPAQVLPGGLATLSWDATPATSVSLSAGTTNLGEYPVKGSLQVTPSATTSYLLQGHGTPDPLPATVAVRVVPLPSVHLSADKTITTAGDAVTLSWSGTGATGYSLDNGIGSLGGATSIVVRPAQTTTYKVTAFGPASGATSDAVTVTISGPAPGSRTLSYADPLVLPTGARLALRKDASSTPSLLLLNVVTLQAVQAGGFSLTTPLDATRVQLDAAQAGDASPGFAVNLSALNPGAAPPAAKAVLGTGPLAGMLVLAVAKKATSPGVVPDATLAAGTVLCTIRLVPAPSGQPGQALSGGAASKVYLGHLPRDPTSQPEQIAVGTLTVN